MADRTILLEATVCPGCDSPNLPSATVCGECGERLTPRPVALPARHGADCPCTACTIALYNEGRAL